MITSRGRMQETWHLLLRILLMNYTYCYVVIIISFEKNEGLYVDDQFNNDGNQL